MWNKDIQLSQIFRGCYLGVTPMILRDFLFRTSLLSVFYGTTHVEHQPNLKFSMSEMINYLKHCRDKGEENVTYQSKQHLFIEYHNYVVKTPMNIRFLLMLLANFVGTVLTNPIDVCLTKLVTQQERKYSGLIDCMKKVYKEEGVWKFTSGIHPRFMFNSINGMLFLYLYDQVITSFYLTYDKRES